MARSTAEDELARGREALRRGKLKPAIRHGWSAAQAGSQRSDATLLADIRSFAEALGEHATGRDANEARILSRYCNELLVQTEAGVKPPGLLAGLFSRHGSKRKKCPDCAEEIQRDARVCRFCGYRYPDD